MTSDVLHRNPVRLLRVLKKFTLVLCSFLYVVLSVQIALSAPFTFNGNWQTLTTQDDGYKELYLQTYNLNFSQNITEAMSLNESFRYTRNWEEEGGIRELFNPSLGFFIVNDLFRFDLNGNAIKNRNSEGANLTTSSWQGVWSSAWQKGMWPRIQIDFGQTFSEDDESPALLDIRNDEWGSNVYWDFDLARLVYNYDRRETTNNANNSDNTIRTNFARLDTGGVFWDNRLDVSLSQQFSNNRRDFSIQAPPSGTVLVPLGIAQVATGIDDTPEDSILTPEP